MTSVSFTEEMKGHVAFGEEDFHQGERLGREQGTELMFHLTIETDDFDRFRADTSHPAVPRGWIGCEALGGRLAVEGGLFNLFVDHPDGGKRMLYRLHFRDGAGHPLTLNGFKVVRDHRGLDLWPDTTTLYTRLLSGHVDAREDAEAARVASGVVRILPLDFARQLTTFRARGGSAGRRGRALAGFAGLFIGDLLRSTGREPPKPRLRCRAETALAPQRPDPGRGRAALGRLDPVTTSSTASCPSRRATGWPSTWSTSWAQGRRGRGPCCSSTAPGFGPTSFARRSPPPSSSVWSPRATTSGSRTGARRSTTSRTAGRSTRRRRWTTPGRSRRSSPKPAPRR